MLCSIGELEAWVHELPFVEAMHGELSGWRKELDNIGREFARQSESPVDCRVGKPVPGDGRINWFGEVTDVSLNGHAQSEVSLYFRNDSCILMV